MILAVLLYTQDDSEALWDMVVVSFVFSIFVMLGIIIVSWVLRSFFRDVSIATESIENERLKVFGYKRDVEQYSEKYLKEMLRIQREARKEQDSYTVFLNDERNKIEAFCRTAKEEIGVILEENKQVQRNIEKATIIFFKDATEKRDLILSEFEGAMSLVHNLKQTTQDSIEVYVKLDNRTNKLIREIKEAKESLK